MAELLMHPLMRAVEEVQTGKALRAAEQRSDPRLHALPRPMIPHSHDEQSSLCAMLVGHKLACFYTDFLLFQANCSAWRGFVCVL